MSDLLKQLENYKVTTYGNIAIQFRRGLISLDEAEYFWNETEGKYLELIKLAKEADVSDSEFLMDLLCRGLEQLLKS